VKLYRIKGQISVFLAIILLAVIMTAGTAVDISRMAAGEAEVRRAVRQSVRSALTEYSTKLKEDYGIFGTYKSGVELKSEIKAGIEKNLMIDAGTFGSENRFNLFDFRIEDINVVPIFNLSENEVVRRQILEYMKYRAPKEMIENTWDKLMAIKNAGKMAETYKRKISVDRLLDKMGKAQEGLKISLDGVLGDKTSKKYFVNGFNKNGSRDKLAGYYADLSEKRKSLFQRLGYLEEEADRIRSRLLGSAGGEESEALMSRLVAVLNEIGDVKDAISDVEDEMDTTISGLYNEFTASFTEPNKNALEYIDRIMEYGEKTGKAIDEVEDYLSTVFTGEEIFAEEFMDSVQEDLLRGRDLILDGRSAEEMRASLETNLELIEKMKSDIEKLKKLIDSEDAGSLSRKQIMDMLTGRTSGYSSIIRYEFAKPAERNGAKDLRKEMEEKGRNAVQTESMGVDLEEAGIVISDLPSRNKKESGSYGDEDKKYLTGWNIDFSDSDSVFADNAMDFVNTIGERLSKSLAELRDEIYVNEYIIGTFKNSVNVLKDGSGDRKDRDLRGVEKEKRETLFEKSEVEYILHGNKSESVNRLMTKGQILLVRFAMNTLHVYTDKDKKALAAGIASAVAGWWTAGAGIPVITHLIMCGWGMGEALIDLGDLMDGRPVPFFKLKGDWRLDIGLPLGGEEKSRSPVLFSYHDYLRLFLMLKDPDTKIDRMEDLIQINIQKDRSAFKMTDCNTWIRVEAVVSMRNFFIAPLFIPEKRRTEDGRYRFEVLVYDGY